MEIGKDFCEGQAFFTQHKDGAAPLVRGTQALRDIADDLTSRTAAVIASPDAVAAAGAAPTKAEFDAVVLLVNEIKAALNAVSSATILTTKAD